MYEAAQGLGEFCSRRTLKVTSNVNWIAEQRDFVDVECWDRDVLMLVRLFLLEAGVVAGELDRKLASSTDVCLVRRYISPGNGGTWTRGP